MATVQYDINITKTGVGGAAAVADLKAVQQGANNASLSLKRMSATSAQSSLALQNFQRTATASTGGLRALQGTAMLLGVTAFPQLTLAATALQGAMSGVRAAAAATGASLLAMSGVFAVIALGVYKTIQATKEYLAMMKGISADTLANAALEQQVQDQAKRLNDLIIKAIDEGRLKLTQFQADAVNRLLTNPTYERLTQIRKMIRELLPQGEFLTGRDSAMIIRQQMADLERSARYSAAQIEYTNPRSVNNKAFQQLQIQMEYNDQVKLYNKLREQGVITETQLRDLTIDADTHRLESLIRLRAQLTEIQQLQQQVVQGFASGLSNAIVSAFKDGQKAFQDFAANFFATTAQMIMQMQILNALKAIGFAGAAAGGIFPRYAAAGVAGVSSVSTATYFPRFNVVAGEAGREMLTVLAKPREMQIGGVETVVGNAGTHRLAITNADQLAGRAGGVLDIRVTLGPELRAEIVTDSVKGAVVQVTNDAQSNTPLRKAIRRGQA